MNIIDKLLDYMWIGYYRCDHCKESTRHKWIGHQFRCTKCNSITIDDATARFFEDYRKYHRTREDEDKPTNIKQFEKLLPGSTFMYPGESLDNYTVRARRAITKYKKAIQFAEKQRKLSNGKTAEKWGIEIVVCLREIEKINSSLSSLPHINLPREHIPESVRQKVWGKYGGRCAECGSTTDLEFDHIIPVIMGGSSTEKNLQVLCKKCNRAKHAKLGINPFDE